MEEAEDRGGVVAQGGGKVRAWTLLCFCPVLLQMVLGLGAAWALWFRGAALAPLDRELAEAVAALGAVALAAGQAAVSAPRL